MTPAQVAGFSAATEFWTMVVLLYGNAMSYCRTIRWVEDTFCTCVELCSPIYCANVLFSYQDAILDFLYRDN